MNTVLITGSSRGLGASLIRKFAENNYNVIITYNTSVDDAYRLKDEIGKYKV